ncbi:DegT/DnrJ/EryC1/StrS family aminotransferase [Marmoricola sp. RAF53]|uniref:DegT/DnrJ/EryC1/StrS family aminotransferase n=1 Tax=Marmoricola sp. RAF53 TaxID=3233059 RepID=UPI003F962404
MNPAADFLPFALPDVGDEEAEAVAAAVRSGWLTSGGLARQFEQDFAEYVGARYAVAVNSATAGLHLALEAVGIQAGDEVLVPTWTFTATAEVVRYLGATPVLVDVDPVTLNIDLAAAEASITPATRAIMPVHFSGLPVPREELRAFAERHDLRVVEDAAHAFPVKSAGRWIGSGDSDAVVFSFYATKTMTTGEGGMLFTESAEIADRARTMRLHGINRDVFDRYQSTKPSWHYEVVAPGYKYNLTDPAAAMGLVQLRRARAMWERRTEIAERYLEAFSDLPVELPPRAPAGDEHAWHLFVIRLPEGADRDGFIQRMAELGVGTSVHFIPLHLQPVWRDLGKLRPEQFPVASREFDRVVSLPIFSSMTDLQVERVVDTVAASLRSGE